MQQTEKEALTREVKVCKKQINKLRAHSENVSWGWGVQEDVQILPFVSVDMQIVRGGPNFF